MTDTTRSNRIWIELDRAPSGSSAAERRAFMDTQCRLANAMLKKLGDMHGYHFFTSHHDMARYCYGGHMCYKELADRGEWFNLDYLSADNHHDALEAPRIGTPELIGYGEVTAKAFGEGWRAAMNMVWEKQTALRAALGFTERTDDEGYTPR